MRVEAAGTGGSSSERRRRHFRLFLRSLEAIFLRASRCRWSCSLVPWLRRRLTGHEEGITLLQRMGVGMVLSVMTMLVSGIGRAAPARAHGAARRREEELHLVHVVEPRLPMSAFWLMPQLAALGLSEMFNQVSQMEFYIYYKQFPEKMRRRRLAPLQRPGAVQLLQRLNAAAATGRKRRAWRRPGRAGRAATGRRRRRHRAARAAA